MASRRWRTFHELLKLHYTSKTPELNIHRTFQVENEKLSIKSLGGKQKRRKALKSSREAWQSVSFTWKQSNVDERRASWLRDLQFGKVCKKTLFVLINKDFFVYFT